MSSSKPAPPPYRWEAFTHWANLAMLGVGGVLGAVHDPLWWVFTAGLSAGVLWVVPDLPPFKRGVDERYRAQRLLEERAFYLNELWGLEDPPPPKGGFFKRLFVADEAPPLESRIIHRNSKSAQDYLEMREIIGKLRELVKVPGVQLGPHDLDRLELICNGYLRLLVACRPLAAAIGKTDRAALQRDLRSLEQQLEGASPAVKATLQERIRIAASQLERHPRMVATYELMHSRAQDMMHQIRNIQAQVLTNPTMDVHGMLDDMASQQEIIADPTGHLLADQDVRSFLAESGRRTAAREEDDGEADADRDRRRRGAQREGP